MQITLTGLVLLLFGGYTFLLNKRTLYQLTIFFIPFSATAIFNFGAPGSGSSIQPYMFFSVIWIVRMQIDMLQIKQKPRVDKNYFIAYSILFIFSSVALISLCMPVVINGQEFGNVSGKFQEILPIRFSVLNISQLAYLYLGILFTFYISIQNKTEKAFNETVDILKYSLIFICVWGWLEFILASLNISFPYFIFNNSFHPAAQGYQSFLGDFKRISSVSVEPSVLSQVLLLPLPLLIYRMGLQNSKWILALVMMTVIFLRSSTAYVGVAVLIIFPILLSKLNRKNISRILMLMVLGIIALPFLGGVLFEIVSSKLISWSFLERFSSVISAWGNFTNYPILGVGWGSVTSYDLIVKLLSNTGIFGFISFFSLMLYICIKLYRKKSHKSNSILISLIVLLVMNQIGGWNFVFGHFWLYLGLGISSINRFSTQFKFVKNNSEKLKFIQLTK